MAVAKGQIRQIISDNNISSVADVYALLKDSFKSRNGVVLKAHHSRFLLFRYSAPLCQDKFFLKLSWILKKIDFSFFSLDYPLSVDI